MLLVLTEQTAVLRGHTGLVKGITWDPVSKYLASQSDDRSVRIWNTFNWQTEKIITKPFEEVIKFGFHFRIHTTGVILNCQLLIHIELMS